MKGMIKSHNAMCHTDTQLRLWWTGRKVKLANRDMTNSSLAINNAGFLFSKLRILSATIYTCFFSCFYAQCTTSLY